MSKWREEKVLCSQLTASTTRVQVQKGTKKEQNVEFGAFFTCQLTFMLKKKANVTSNNDDQMTLTTLASQLMDVISRSLSLFPSFTRMYFDEK